MSLLHSVQAMDLLRILLGITVVVIHYSRHSNSKIIIYLFYVQEVRRHGLLVHLMVHLGDKCNFLKYEYQLTNIISFPNSTKLGMNLGVKIFAWEYLVPSENRKMLFH